MRILVALMLAIGLAPTGSLAATLNKCIDTQGRVTYSNLPCRNAKEVQKLEIDPPPLPEPARPSSSRTQAAPSKTAQPRDSQPAPETRRPSGNAAASKATPASARECDTLSEKLGNVLDKMDKAHRKGYTQDEMDKWNQEARDLEKKKQKAGCF